MLGFSLSLLSVTPWVRTGAFFDKKTNIRPKLAEVTAEQADYADRFDVHTGYGIVTLPYIVFSRCCEWIGAKRKHDIRMMLGRLDCAPTGLQQ